MNEEISHVVVHDPNNKFKPGSLIGSTSARMYGSRGVVSIPLQVERLKFNGCAGYVLKHYGSGWPLDIVSPRIVCPMVLSVGQGDTKLVWRAGLKKQAGALVMGFVRLVSDSGQVNVSGIGLGPSQAIVLEELPVDDETCVVGGESAITMNGEQYVGLGLYGKGDGVSVEWVAVSQALR